jgi:uncharacterized protein (TIRG00374 family)
MGISLHLQYMNAEDREKYIKLKKNLSPVKMVLPILLGLGMVFWLMSREISPETFSFFKWTTATVFWILLAFLMMVVRDVAYMWRLRILTSDKITWRNAFQVIMLWEFSSAISPSVVGGTGPAIYFIYKEGINLGKSTAVVLAATFLDELFYIIMVPLLILIFRELAFPAEKISFLGNLIMYFWIGYSVIFFYTLILIYALFINPQTIKKFLSRVFLLPFLKRWRLKVRKLSNQLIITSEEFKGKGTKFWLKAFGATFLSWTGRFWVINFLFMAFFFNHLGIFDHFLIYARQLTMWILLLISPTPGGSGVAEFIFKDFLGDIIPNIEWAIPLALMWRLISYYPYLIIGAFVLPRWLRKIFFKGKLK